MVSRYNYDLNQFLLNVKGGLSYVTLKDKVILF